MTGFHSQVSSLVQDAIPLELHQWLPRGWNRIGHVAVLSLSDILLPYRDAIGRACLAILRGVRTIAIRVGPTIGTFRTPQLEVIAGDPQTETLHKEHGCLFELDAKYLTFSSGNHYERKRMIEIIAPGSTVVDMFACVGNLSLPVAVYKPVQVIGIEINPLAFKYLVRNISRNKIEARYQPLLGDNRELTPTNWADHVIMGCWDCDPPQIHQGIEALKAKNGGWIHFHEVVPPNQQPSAFQRFNASIEASTTSLVVVQSRTRRVKGVAPRFSHMVTDLLLSPSNWIDLE